MPSVASVRLAFEDIKKVLRKEVGTRRSLILQEPEDKLGLRDIVAYHKNFFAARESALLAMSKPPPGTEEEDGEIKDGEIKDSEIDEGQVPMSKVRAVFDHMLENLLSLVSVWEDTLLASAVEKKPRVQAAAVEEQALVHESAEAENFMLETVKSEPYEAEAESMTSVAKKIRPSMLTKPGAKQAKRCRSPPPVKEEPNKTKKPNNLQHTLAKDLQQVRTFIWRQKEWYAKCSYNSNDELLPWEHRNVLVQQLLDIFGYETVDQLPLSPECRQRLPDLMKKENFPY